VPSSLELSILNCWP